MDHEQFDAALIRAAMARAEAAGWRRVAVVDAARDAELPLDEARVRFPRRSTVLLRLGLLADRAALASASASGSVRERLFDLLMHRIDVLQRYRGGVRAVLRAVPLDPGLALLLTTATDDSLRWIARAAGMEILGLAGALRVKGLGLVWLQAVRAWDKDESPDLSGTMAALDKVLDRAERVDRMLYRPRPSMMEAETMPADGIATTDSEPPAPAPDMAAPSA